MSVALCSGMVRVVPTCSRILGVLAPQTHSLPSHVLYYPELKPKARIVSSPPVLGQASGAVRLESPHGFQENFSESAAERLPKLVIFDKNGTLINFHVNWSPWIQKMANRLELLTGKSIQGQIYRQLDVCMFTKKVRSGLLAHGTTRQIKQELEDILVEAGVPHKQAEDNVERCWIDCDTSNQETLQAVADLKPIFTDLQSRGIKVAVCTSDSRRISEKTLRNLGLLSLVDMLVCGDDPDSIPKPSAHNTHVICDVLGVSMKDTVVIGDTEADVYMGKKAGVGLTIGVLSGIGTRLDLSPHADCVVENIKEAIPIILKQKNITIENHVPRVTKVVDEGNSQAKAKLVIFDKDGTLICFHSMWTPWAKAFVSRLETATGLSLYHKTMDELGYCHHREKWISGLFAEGTAGQTQDRIIEILQKEGISAQKAEQVMTEAWQDGDHSLESAGLKTLGDLAMLFRTLKENNVKIAICTADNRQPTQEFLEEASLDKYVDLLVCGDDHDTVPKPSPHNAIKICKTLGIPPSLAIVVGDTKADLGMGRSAELGATVAVLSGVGDVEDLDSKADHIVKDIDSLLPIVLNKTHVHEVKG